MMKKKKKCTVVAEDENTYPVVRHFCNGKPLPSSSSKPTKECMIQKSADKGTAPPQNAPLSILLSREAKENRTLQPKNSIGIPAAERHLPGWLRNSGSSSNVLEKKNKKKNGAWSWGSIRAANRLSCDRLPCLISVYIDAINGLPSSMNVRRVMVKLQQRNKGRAVHTKPCSVINGTADIDETLQMRSTVCCRKAKHGCQYSPTDFSICICSTELGGRPLSRHSLDLTGVLPCSLDDLSSPRRIGTRATALKLTGKARGGVLVVTFACRILENTGTCAVPCNSKSSPCIVSPCMSDLDLNDAPPSLESSASEEPPRPMRALVYSSSEEDMEFSVVEQGVEMGTLLLAEGNSEGKFSEILQNGLDYKPWDGEQANGRYPEQARMMEEEMARLETRLDAEEVLREKPSVYGGSKSLVEDSDKVQEAFLDGIEAPGQKQIIIGSSDDDIDSVTGEFLDLLEGRQGVSGTDGNSPRRLPSREFQQMERARNQSPGLEREAELSFMDAVELEMQKAEQALRSKARAKILEDAETEALMRHWGLNEKAFEVSPSKSGGNSARNVIPSPPLADGIGFMVQTRDGGYIRSVNPVSSVGGVIGGQLVMQVSKPAVVPAEMGSNAMDILRTMAALGLDNLVSQAMLAMPMEDITGKTIQQISLGGSSTFEAPHRGATGLLSSGEGCASRGVVSHLSPFNCDGALMTHEANSGPAKDRFKTGMTRTELQSAGDSLDEYVALQDLAPMALQKIEALALEGLKIQANMTDQDAPSSVDPKPLLSFENRHAKQGGAGPAMVDGVNGMHLLASKHYGETVIQGEGIMEAAISLEKWMKLDVGVTREAENKDHTYAVKDAPQVLANANLENDYDRRKSNNSPLGCMNDTLTIAMLVQLRDPLRDYEPVGAPMIALIQAERVLKPPRPKLSKQVSTRGNGEPEEEAEEQKPVQQQPQFKITEVHMSGIKSPEPDKKKGWFFQKWGGKKQEQSASRWLIANGMGKKTKPALPKSKPPSSQSVTTVKPGETLWSISSRVHGTGSKWQEIASLNPHIRNPDIIFANQTIRTK